MKGLALPGSSIVRAARHADLPSVLCMMRQLAEFEGYLDQFEVTEPHLREGIFARKSFSVLVAEMNQEVVGMLVYYPLPFTYDCQPWWVLKELFVSVSVRSCGVGENLLREVFERARCADVSRIRWEVLRANVRAQKFYQSLNAQPRENWLSYGVRIHD